MSKDQTTYRNFFSGERNDSMYTDYDNAQRGQGGTIGSVLGVVAAAIAIFGVVRIADLPIAPQHAPTTLIADLRR